jgi:serine/threonine-protein kinase
MDPALRQEAADLLVMDALSTTTIEREIGQAAEWTLARFERSGARCGSYELRGLLGHGGMGAVYLAERVDGEVVQQAAVKLLRHGADLPALRQRFLEERQILATLSHPNVAKLLDAGHREDGQPYLVMEYIQEQPIDVYAPGLSLPQTLALFLKVCAAVSYMHRNLVIHRDLKPSNIRVTAEGKPKLLDFGIAKVIDEKFDSTLKNMRIGTPDYASPEQWAARRITTASDTYSLGAVLYKMLTGEAPRYSMGDFSNRMPAAIGGIAITQPSGRAPLVKRRSSS